MPKKDNDITDWYSKLGASSVKLGKDYQTTHILPDTRILCLGKSGAGIGQNFQNLCYLIQIQNYQHETLNG